MNNIKIGIELKKLIYKRNKGAGEYSYVYISTGKEAVGKNEVFEMLLEDIENWETISALKLKSESNETFYKKVKKQLPLVLFENTFKEKTYGHEAAEEPKPKQRKIESTPVILETEEIKANKPEEPAKELQEISCVNENIVEEEKPKNIKSFQLAEVPLVTETIKVEDDEDKENSNGVEKIPDEDTISVNDLLNLDQDKKRVLTFLIKKEIPHKECKQLLGNSDVFAKVTAVQRTLAKDNKFRGVYLLTFLTEDSARDYESQELQINGVVLEKMLLLDYKKEKYFQRSILKTRAFKANTDFIVKELQDLKEDGRLDNCVVFQVEVEEEEVQEYYCGISSDFVENFVDDHPLEEVRTISSPKIPQYILVFESSEGAKKFKNSPQYHKVGEKEGKVSLLTDRMKLCRYGEKIKNFTDASEFSPADHDRRIVITAVKRNASSQDIDEFFKTNYPDHQHLLRCCVDELFFGCYIVTFGTKDEAEEFLEIEYSENTVVYKSNLVMLLSEYCSLREKFLNMKQFYRRKRKVDELDKWVNEFSNLEKKHEELWGPDGVEENENFERTENSESEEDDGYNPMKMLRTKCDSS